MNRKQSSKSKQQKSSAEQPTAEEIKEFARQISTVLTNPLIPAVLYNAMVDAISELNMPASYLDQPEYIGALLANYFNEGGQR